MLVAAGANGLEKDDEGMTPEAIARINKNAELSAMCQPPDGRLLEAIEKRDLAKMRAALETGASANCTGQSSETALNLIAAQDFAEGVKLLLDSKANVNAKGKGGSSPLHVAAMNGAAEALKLLIGGGASVNAKDEDGDTPLHAAAFKGQLKVASLLCEAGADVKATNSDDDTPLHGAASNYSNGTAADRLELAKLLVAKGAPQSAQNKEDKTAYDLASEAEVADQNLIEVVIGERDRKRRDAAKAG